MKKSLFGYRPPCLHSQSCFFKLSILSPFTSITFFISFGCILLLVSSFSPIVIIFHPFSFHCFHDYFSLTSHFFSHKGALLTEHQYLYAHPWLCVSMSGTCVVLQTEADDSGNEWRRGKKRGKEENQQRGRDRRKGGERPPTGEDRRGLIERTKEGKEGRNNRRKRGGLRNWGKATGIGSDRGIVERCGRGRVR